MVDMKLKWVAIGIGLGLVLVSLVYLTTFSSFSLSPKNTYLLDKNYSFLTLDQVQAKIAADFNLPPTLTLISGTHSFSIDTASFSAQINRSQTAAQLLRPLSFSSWFSSTRHHYPLIIDYSSADLQSHLASQTATLNQPIIPYQLVVVASPPSVTLQIGQSGTVVNLPALKDSVISSLSQANLSPIDIPFEIQTATVSASQANADLDRAQKLLTKNLILTVSGQAVTIPGWQLASWVDFNNQYHQDAIIAYAASLSASLKQDPINAVFKFDNNQVTDFQPSQNGRTVAATDIVTSISNGLSQLTSLSDTSLTLSLPLTTLEPAIKTAAANNLGIEELLGEGSSTFHHSDSVRNKNIAKGSEIVNRILVAPGDEFSFIKNLGEVSLDRGFQKAYIIREGKTELDVGGGICQVSTTLFRAMLAAGVSITQRQNHAYRVSYYEEDSRPGFDATVFIPNPDLRFVNDTGHYLLIQNIFDLPNRRLTYQIYGTPDGRQVEITNYKQWNQQPAPADKYIDDPTLPAGKLIQTEHRVAGLNTSFDWIVTRDGQTLHQKTFKSVYVPWAAVYRRGTGAAQ